MVLMVSRLLLPGTTTNGADAMISESYSRITSMPILVNAAIIDATLELPVCTRTTLLITGNLMCFLCFFFVFFSSFSSLLNLERVFHLFEAGTEFQYQSTERAVIVVNGLYEDCHRPTGEHLGH